MAFLHVMSPGSAYAELGRTSFVGPDGCEAALLDDALRRLLERPNTDGAVPDDVSVHVRARRVGGRFVLTLDVRRADGATTHRRIWHATRCDLLLQTAALIAALAIDPDVADRQVEPSDAPGLDPPTDPPSPAELGPGPAVAPPAAVPPAVLEVELEAPTLAHVALEPPTHRQRRTVLGVGLGPTLAFGMFGVPAGGAAVLFALLRGHLRVELRLSTVVFHSVALGEPGWRIRIVDYGADLAGCYAPAVGSVSFPFCAQLGAAGETARASSQVPNAGRATRGRVSIAQRVGVRWAVSRQWQLGVDAEIAEQVIRPAFGVESSVRLARAQRVGYRTTLSWTALWP